MSNIKTTIYVSVQAEGVHRWPAATQVFPKVGYLSNLHRHTFHIKAHKPVNHDDRDVEFIMFKHDIQEYLVTRYWSNDMHLYDFGSMSCEMIAREILQHFDCTTVEVNEDNECGAILTNESTRTVIPTPTLSKDLGVH